MLASGVAPYLKALSDSHILSHNIQIFGLGESAVEEKLRDLMESLSNPTLAPYAKDGEVMLRLTAKARTNEEADRLMAPVLEQIRETLGDIVYGVDTGSLEATVVGLMRERGLTLAAAESCTGGLLSKRLTDVPGASQVFIGSAVTYSAKLKTSLLGVDANLIDEYKPASKEVAIAMAEGARFRLGADIGVGITGIAGPDSDESMIAPGTVFAALATEGASFCRSLRLVFDREWVRIGSVNNALDMLRRYLTGMKVE